MRLREAASCPTKPTDHAECAASADRRGTWSDDPHHSGPALADPARVRGCGRRGLLRRLAFALLVAAPGVVIVVYAVAGVLWEITTQR